MPNIPQCLASILWSFCCETDLQFSVGRKCPPVMAYPEARFGILTLNHMIMDSTWWSNRTDYQVLRGSVVVMGSLHLRIKSSWRLVPVSPSVEGPSFVEHCLQQVALVQEVLCQGTLHSGVLVVGGQSAILAKSWVKSPTKLPQVMWRHCCLFFI